MPQRVMILATDGFEQSELTGPKERLEQAGYETVVVSPEEGEIKGWQHTDWGDAVLQGKTVTGWPSIRTDLKNAGAEVVDREVAQDGNLITSRKPDDIPAFSEALIKALQEARVSEPAE
jgi:putative intracellular protease/amidase